MIALTLGEVVLWAALGIGGLLVPLVIIAAVVFIAGANAIVHGDEGDA